MIWSAWAPVGSSELTIDRIWDAFWMGPSGLRSSCPSIARKASFSFSAWRSASSAHFTLSTSVPQITQCVTTPLSRIGKPRPRCHR